MSDEHADAVIVGGGPGGAVAAMLLARLGWRVVLAEKGPADRDKACGHCLSPHAIELLGRIGLRQRVHAIACGETSVIQVMLEQSTIVRLPLRHMGRPCEGWVTGRSRLDPVLREAAMESGAKVHCRTAARIVERNAAETRVQLTGAGWDREVSAGLVIGADGLGSRVARAFGMANRNAAGRRFGFAGDLPMREPMAQGEVRMRLVRRGYVGMVRDGEMVHFAGMLRAETESPDAVLDRMGLALNGRSFLGAGPMPWRPQLVATSRAALIGDAAGYEEPFSGEGIYWALRSAELLAETCAGTRHWDERAAARYRSAWSASIGRAQASCRRLGWLLARPGLCGVLGRVIAALPAIDSWALRPLYPTPC